MKGCDNLKKRIVAFFLCCVMVFQNVFVSYASGLVIPAVEAIGAEEGLAILLSCLGFSLGDDFASRDAAREKYMEAMSKADFTIVEGGGGNGQKPTNQFKEFCSNVAKGIGGTVTIGKELWQTTTQFVTDNLNLSESDSPDVPSLMDGVVTGTLLNASVKYPVLTITMFNKPESHSYTVSGNCYTFLSMVDDDLRFNIMTMDKNASIVSLTDSVNLPSDTNAIKVGDFYIYRLAGMTSSTSRVVSCQGVDFFSQEKLITDLDAVNCMRGDIPSHIIDMRVGSDKENLLYPSEELKKYLDKFGVSAIQRQDVVNNNYYITKYGLKGATRTIEVPANYQELLDNFKNGTLTYPELMDNYNATAVTKESDTRHDGKIDAYDDVDTYSKKMEPDFDKPLNGVDSDSKKMVYDLKSFFPFCIPFDFIDLLRAFSAPAQTPKFHYCIKIEKFNVDWNVDLDLTDFNTLAYWCRVFETIIFIFILMKLTSKLIKW